MKDLGIETVVERRLGFATIYLKRIRTGLNTCFDVDLDEAQALIEALREAQDELKEKKAMSGVNVSRAMGEHCHKVHCSKGGIYRVGEICACRQHVRALLDAALQADLIERVKTVTTKIAEKANAEGKIAPLSDAEEEAIIEHYADDFPAGMVMSQESHYEGEDEPDEGKED